MSARINLQCDTQWRYGGCPRQLLTDANTVDEARATARAYGWITHSNGRDMCASCSGRGPQPADAVVAILHPERTP